MTFGLRSASLPATRISSGCGSPTCAVHTDSDVDAVIAAADRIIDVFAGTAGGMAWDSQRKHRTTEEAR